MVFDAIAGPDGQDLAVVDRPFNWDGNAGFGGLRVGFLASAFEREPGEDDAGTLANDLAALQMLRTLGVDPAPVNLPEHAEMDALQMLLVDEAAAFDELILNGDVELFRQDIDEPEDMLMRIARLHPAVEYLQIQRRRMLLMQGMARIFDDIDVLVAPFSGSTVQSATSLTGHPSIAVPSGFDENGKPTGIQFIGQIYGEAEAMRLARVYQDSTDFHRRTPPLFN